MTRTPDIAAAVELLSIDGRIKELGKEEVRLHKAITARRRKLNQARRPDAETTDPQLFGLTEGLLRNVQAQRILLVTECNLTRRKIGSIAEALSTIEQDEPENMGEIVGHRAGTAADAVFARGGTVEEAAAAAIAAAEHLTQNQ